MEHALELHDTDTDTWGVLSELPGNPMMWVLILSEMVAFGLFFMAFAVARVMHPAEFAAGQAQLDPLLGGINTMVLVTSGWLMALAVRARGLGKVGSSRLLTVGAMLVGSLFVIVKLAEYGAKIQAGHGLDDDVFFTLYFLLTGFHFLHVLLGLAILGLVAWRNSLDNLETGAAFWHMVDLVWVVLYPLVYLVR
jgi:nitric oxide reductase NorE protein